ncbi:hypothetical protein Dsin_028932 [Dipteronia sinensis]|uniref:C3H1-type domain-containing protein n=1 Tax=Dipteronia sinensis TaxID=43782 RepID=A0AAE0DV10_9ROSI|nr:hypothetical protein Dsin_028932 [Dipteronia sinensis]
MQNESLSSSAYVNIGAASAKSPESHNGDGIGSLYSPFVLAQERHFREPSMNVNDAFYYSRLLMQQQQQQQQHQDMVNRHSLCLTRLREAAKDAEILRQENASLRSVNLELNKHIGLLIKSSVTANDHHHHHHQPAASSNDFENISSSAATTSFENMVNVGMRGLRIGGGGGGGDHREEVSVESPTSVMENVDVKRVSLPKSISVRSNGYLKMGPPPAAAAAAAAAAPVSSNSKARPRAAAPLTCAQKVYVRGGKREEEPLELEVYNQGMFKTELCNKWQETGACPYGDHCQFAHGIEELRPVIRHPRYKTEVCRMVLAGDVCPYGHRCHFRHALTDQERFMGHMNPRSIKLN